MKRLPFVPTILVLIAIAYLSLAEQPVDPDKIRLFEGADKLVHGCMYAVLVWVGCFDFYRRQERREWWCWLDIMLVAMAFGSLMEWLQGVITVERSADVYDSVANNIGAMVGLWLAWWSVPRVYRRLCR